MQVHERALRQWQTPEGVRALVHTWETAASKAEAERIVGELVARCDRHDRIVELGCGTGRLIAALPRFRRYYGFDWSAELLTLARERWGNDKRCSFEALDFLEGPPNPRLRPHVLLCVHVARHYSDPIALMRRVMTLWPARWYVFSVLCGPQARELLNCYCVPCAAVDAFASEAGAEAMMGQAEADGMATQYLLVRG